jgi:hypothetical protein
VTPRRVLSVEVLEYLTWGHFQDALRDPPDVLGISFYINETGLTLRIADHARRCGVKEVWCGSFGAYSPQAAPYFDRVAAGCNVATLEK